MEARLQANNLRVANIGAIKEREEIENAELLLLGQRVFVDVTTKPAATYPRDQVKIKLPQESTLLRGDVKYNRNQCG